MAHGAGEHTGHRSTIVLLVLAIVVWGIHWPVMKVGLGHMTPLWLAALRFLTGGAVLFAYVGATGKLRLPPKADWPIVLSLGLAQMMLNVTLLLYGLQLVPPGRSSVIAYTTPFWVAPGAALFLGERITLRKAIGTVLGLLGIVAIVNPFGLDWRNPSLIWGYALLIAAAAVWAACILHIRGHRWHASPLELSPWEMLVATVPLVALACIVDGPVPGDGSATFYVVMAYTGPIATGFAYSAVIAVNKRIPASTMSVAMLGVPVVGLASSALFMGERLDLPLLIGAAAIIAGIVLCTVAGRPRLEVENDWPEGQPSEIRNS